MVRINIIEPRKLSDQHLIAEYNEILMLVGHVKKYPAIKNKVSKYCLGKGHINFFKDKLKYLEKRHILLKKEMLRRGFKANKTLNIKNFNNELKKDWRVNKKAEEVIKKRLKEKLKNNNYRYYGEYKPYNFFIKLFC